MKATVLVDNTAWPGLRGEWGLSIYIEYGDKIVLLDAGASGLFAENAEKLGLPLERVDYAALSHAHYDHGDGMGVFFQKNRKASFYLRRTAEQKYYSKELLFFRRYIGVPQRVLKEYAGRIVYVSGDYELTPGVRLLPHAAPAPESIGRRDNLYAVRGNKLIPDPFTHEQSLVFDTPEGLVVFNSCSHSGVANIIREVEEAYPGKQVRAMIGGFHLHNKTDAEVTQVAGLLKETGVQQIVTGHCTGDNSLAVLKRELGDRVQAMHSGLALTF